MPCEDLLVVSDSLLFDRVCLSPRSDGRGGFFTSVLPASASAPSLLADGKKGRLRPHYFLNWGCGIPTLTAGGTLVEACSGKAGAAVLGDDRAAARDDDLRVVLM